jgi:hypothetical protein
MDPTNQPTDPMRAGLPPAPGAVPGGPDAAPPVWNLPPAPVPVAPVVPAMTAAPARRRRDPLTMIMFVAAFIALAGVGFAVGRVTAPAATATVGGRGGNGFNFPNGGSFAPGASGAGGAGLGRFAGGVSIRGTITEVTADHITLKLTNGSTVTIPVDSNTAYHHQTSATSSDVTSGASVIVQLTAGVGGGGGGGLQPNASGAPGIGGRAVSPASDVTIVGQ